MFISFQNQELRNIKDILPNDELEENGVEYILLTHKVSGKSKDVDTTQRFNPNYPIPVLMPGFGLFIIDTEGELGKANQLDYMDCTVTLINILNGNVVFTIPFHAKSYELEGKRRNKPMDFVVRIFGYIYQGNR